MFRLIDAWLDRVTMYRLLLYYLIGLVGLAVLFSWLSLTTFDPRLVLASAGVLVTLTWGTNFLFAKLFGAPVHNDSAYISGLILSLIISPFQTWSDWPLFVLAPVAAMASKYILAIRKQHVFNPAAFAVMVTALTLKLGASWWVGSSIMLVPVLIGGVLLIRKLRRWDVVWSFLGVTLAVTLMFGLLKEANPVTLARAFLVSSPVFFFAFVMLPEPVTMPPRKTWRTLYGGFVGLLFVPYLHFGSFYFTPEMSLLAGNLVFYALTRRRRYVLTLRRQEELAPSVVEFVFEGERPSYRAGQYAEWLLPHPKSDGRGQRRYFTLASAPSENEIRLGVKFYAQPSTFKRSLRTLEPGAQVVASQLDGDFVLPADPRRPCAWIAGGIGITPFRSMTKSLLDTRQTRQIVMFYANQAPADIVYRHIFDAAQKEMGMKTIYTLTDETKTPAGWPGERGFVTPEMIGRYIERPREWMWFISGPQAMVTSYRMMLVRMGLPRRQLRTDYFPGLA